MRALIKFMSAAALAFVVGLFIVIRHSAVESRFSCEGESGWLGEPEVITVYLKLHEFRWWVGLWSDSDAELWFEIPNRRVISYSTAQKRKNSIDFFRGNDVDFAQLAGRLSRISNGLIVADPGIFEFDGQCAPIAFGDWHVERRGER